MLKKKTWAIFKELWTFYPKSCHKALKNMGMGSGTQRSKRHRIPDTDPQHCLHLLDLVSPACLTAVLKQESAFSSSSTRTYSWPSSVYAYANRLSTCTARWKNLNKKKICHGCQRKCKFLSVLWIRNEFFFGSESWSWSCFGSNMHFFNILDINLTFVFPSC